MHAPKTGNKLTNEQMLAALDDVKKGVSANCAVDANGIP